MGLRDLFRKHKKDHHKVPCPSNTDKIKTQQPSQQQQQPQPQKQDNSGLPTFDVSATM
jgi:hypothetical protein